MDTTVQSNLDILFRQSEIRFQEANKAEPQWAVPGGFIDVIPTKTRIVDMAWMSRLPTMRQWVGPRVVNAASTHTKRIVNQAYELSLGLSQDDVEDDQLGILAISIKQMAEQTAKLKDHSLADFLLTADSVIGYDGVGLFSTSHPITGGDVTDPSITGVQSNLLLNSALNYTNYATARAQMMSLKGEDGRPLNCTPNILAVPPQLESAGKAILEATDLANLPATVGGTSVGLTQSNVYRGSAKLVVIPDLARKPSTWYLFCTTKAVKPFMWSQRKAAEFTYKIAPTDENVWSRREYLYGACERGQISETLWFLSFAGTSNSTYQGDNS